MQLRAQEKSAGLRRGLKQHRTLRAAAGGTNGLKPKPPKGPKRSKVASTSGYDGPLAAGSSVTGPSHSAVTSHSAVMSDGSAVMYAPALQPMPRFMGAGPIANGQLLRSRNPGFSKSSDSPDRWTNVGTI